MVVLSAARHRVPVPALARWLLGLGIAATLTANMALGWSHGPVGAVAAYRLSVRAGNPLSERRLAQMFGRSSRRWARARIADARQASSIQESPGIPPWLNGRQDLGPGVWRVLPVTMDGEHLTHRSAR